MFEEWAWADGPCPAAAATARPFPTSVRERIWPKTVAVLKGEMRLREGTPELKGAAAVGLAFSNLGRARRLRLKSVSSAGDNCDPNVKSKSESGSAQQPLYVVVSDSVSSSESFFLIQDYLDCC